MDYPLVELGTSRFFDTGWEFEILFETFEGSLYCYQGVVCCREFCTGGPVFGGWGGGGWENVGGVWELCEDTVRSG